MPVSFRRGRTFRPAFAATLLLAASCAAPYVRRTEIDEAESRRRADIVAAAQRLLGKSDITALGAPFRNDCTGFVLGVYASCGCGLTIEQSRRTSMSDLMYRAMKKRGLVFYDGRPLPGDAVFFQNTTERGFDRVSHAGLVEQTFPDGTVQVIHYGSGKVGRMVLNLRHPYDRKDGSGTVINDYLRIDPSSRNRRDYLAGALFVAYGDLYAYAATESQK